MRRARNRLLIAVVASALALLALPALALAAQAAPGAPAASRTATRTAPLASGPIDAQVWPAQDGKTTGVIVDVVLDPKVKLPARIRIPVPKGAVVQWAGEILSGDASNDQQREFTIQEGQGGSYAEFTLTASRRGQIDAAGIPMTANGNQVSTTVEWIQSVPAISTVFSVRLPAGVSSVAITPAPQGTPQINTAGESLYSLPQQALATGSTTVIKVGYNLSPTGAAGASGAPSSNLTAVYLVLGVLLVGAIAVVVYLMTRQRAAQAVADDRPGVDAKSARRAGRDGAASAGASKPAEPDDDPFDIDFDEK
jgi:hypothetical protein